MVLPIREEEGTGIYPEGATAAKHLRAAGLKASYLQEKDKRQWLHLLGEGEVALNLAVARSTWSPALRGTCSSWAAEAGRAAWGVIRPCASRSTLIEVRKSGPVQLSLRGRAPRFSKPWNASRKLSWSKVRMTIEGGLDPPPPEDPSETWPSGVQVEPGDVLDAGSDPRPARRVRRGFAELRRALRLQGNAFLHRF